MSGDIRLSVGFFTHHKTVKLERRLGYQGIKALLQLWLWTAQHRSDGVLTGMDIEDIEIAATWSGDPGVFVSALESMRWLDLSEGVYSVHGWDEHQSWLMGAKARSERAKKAISTRWGSKDECAENTPSIPDECAENTDAIPSSSPLLSQEKNINPELSEAASTGDTPAEEQNPTSKRGHASHCPKDCPQEQWDKYLNFSRRFHEERATVLGSMAPFSEGKVLEGAKAMDNLIRVKGVPKDELVASIVWATEDDFWSKQIRSLAALTNKSRNGDTKYANLRAAYQIHLERPNREPVGGSHVRQ